MAPWTYDRTLPRTRVKPREEQERSGEDKRRHGAGFAHEHGAGQSPLPDGVDDTTSDHGDDEQCEVRQTGVQA